MRLGLGLEVRNLDLGLGLDLEPHGLGLGLGLVSTGLGLECLASTLEAFFEATDIMAYAASFKLLKILLSILTETHRVECQR